MIRFLTLLLLYFFAGSVLAADMDAPVLRKGINLSNWLANAVRQPLDERDFAQIEAAGFDHVRLPVNPELMGFRLETNETPDAGFAPVDRAIALARSHHLVLILDIHTSSSFKKKLEDDPTAAGRFNALWNALAIRYQPINSHDLVFELLNEPGFYHKEAAYQTFAQQLADTIHSITPKRVIIIDAPHGSSINGLLAMKPINASPVIYSFHFYEPYMITHQGIHQGFEQQMLRFFSHVPYPSADATKDAAFYAPDAVSATQAQNEFHDYVSAGWDRDKIAGRIKLAREWAVQNNTQIICGEFGVLRNNIEPDSRYRWIADTRDSLEQTHIGWELWDYTDIFGITALTGKTSIDPVDGSIRLLDPKTSQRIFEPQALQALGLNPAGTMP